MLPLRVIRSRRRQIAAGSDRVIGSRDGPSLLRTPFPPTERAWRSRRYGHRGTASAWKSQFESNGSRDLAHSERSCARLSRGSLRRAAAPRALAGRPARAHVRAGALNSRCGRLRVRELPYARSRPRTRGVRPIIAASKRSASWESAPSRRAGPVGAGHRGRNVRAREHPFPDTIASRVQSFLSTPVTAAIAAVASTHPRIVSTAPHWAGPSAIHASC